MIVTAHHLGRVEYADGLELQRQFSEARRAGTVNDTLLLLEHAPVLTLGRAAKANNIVAPKPVLDSMGVTVFETDRGGDVTYHGPGQIVGYPLLHLVEGKQDVHKYIHAIEEVLIRTLADYSIASTRIEKRLAGVWIEQSRLGGPRKICAVGVHLSRWYTRHGFALNVNPDLSHFELIVPCGIRDAGVTSMSAELQRPVDVTEVEARIEYHFGQVFEAQLQTPPTPKQTIAVAVMRDDGHVLLLKRTEARGGFWQIVTGTVEPGESPSDAAQRELREETSLSLIPTPVQYVHSFAQGGPWVTQETGYFVQVSSSQAIALSAEHTELEWVPVEVALEKLPFEGLREVVRRACSAKKGPTRPGPHGTQVRPVTE